MNSKVSITLFLVFYVIISCKDKGTPMWNASNDDVKRWKEEALTKGDTIAYRNLSTDYMDSHYKSFLETALTMANKYEYHLAYSDVYDCLTDVDRKYGTHELEPLSAETRKLAIEMLKKGAEKGNSNCQHKLGELYIEGIYVDKNVGKGNKLISESY